ncbi:MAG TPA: threonine/serine dehydratase [Gemmatimonadota bacterium]|nr:threonine/serine dehydratase [Gemmatimonadota bacterium]
MAGRVHRTPMQSSRILGERAGVRLLFKPELLQKTGSFKVRGVLNALHHLSPEERRRGVVTLSAGNHAQALAWGAGQYGIRAVVVMPAGAPTSKIEATRGYGGEVVLTEGDLLETCLTIQREQDLTLVHPFDDPRIIAGQGTVGLEIVEDVPDVDAVVVSVGGGGLISGIATAVKGVRPEARVFGVEPEGSAVMRKSLDLGEPIVLRERATIADGLNAPFAGRHTLAHIQARVDDLVLVEDAEIVQALRLILSYTKLLAEPAAAASLAGLLTGRLDVARDATVACVLSGGNVDLELLKEFL